MDAIVRLDGSGAIRHANDAFTALTGFAEDDVAGSFLPSLLVPRDRVRAATALRAGASGARGFETVVRHRDGREIEVELVILPGPSDGEDAAGFVVLRDIAPHKERQRELEDRALHDPLTALPNRLLLLDRLEHALHRIGRTGGRVALLYVDLDRFKEVNDTAGHAAGDAVLHETARRLQQSLRDGDTIARLGGDEFGILVEDLGEVTEAVATARRIAEVLAIPFRLEGGREVRVGGSVGLAFSSADTTEPSELMRQADRAMYEAKRRGGNRFEIFSREMEAAGRRPPDSLADDLRRAIARDEILLHYQPIVELATSRIVAVEALVRWRHPQHGLVHPAAFIPGGERSGLTLALDRWVLARACGEALAWIREGRVADDFVLSVNLSPRELDEGIVHEVREILQQEEFPANRLQLEIGEGIAARGKEVVGTLKTLGIRVALDDFGTDTSSLAYLRELPADALKLDRSLVTGVAGDRAALAAVRAILALGAERGIPVIAEGVEDPLQLRHVRDMGARLAQGYYFGSPCEPSELRRAFREGLPPAWAWRPAARVPAPVPEPAAAHGAGA